MFKRNGPSCAVLVLTLSSPVFAQEATPSPEAADVIQDPMPHSKAPASAQSGPTQVKANPPAPRQTARTAHKRQKEAPTLSVSINPALLLFGGFGAEFEGAVDPSISLFAAPSYVFGSPLFTSTTDVSLSGFGLDAGMRYFGGGQAPGGLWIGPYASLAFVNAHTSNVEVKATALGFGGMIGYSWIFDSSFYLSIGAGGGYRAIMLDTTTSVSSNSTGSANSSTSSGPALNLRLALGFAQ
jgi:hypothetical protein